MYARIPTGCYPNTVLFTTSAVEEFFRKGHSSWTSRAYSMCTQNFNKFISVNKQNWCRVGTGDEKCEMGRPTMTLFPFLENFQIDIITLCKQRI